MNPSEFISFNDKKPDKNKWIIVTNNIDAKNAHGEMSHVWLTIFWALSEVNDFGIVTFDEMDRKIVNLTHWKYA